ncbi:MAG TPA: GDP-L-fucose synthase [Actinomycetota bacterium]|nr:GDP-L-fucose synthase [Actinomycetota bacterium]
MDLRGERVLVTGGTGFLGSHVAEELRRAGAEVSALGRSDGDLTQRGVAARLLGEIRPSAVVHLAARVGGIGANREAAGAFFYENAIMGIELIEACRLAGVAKVLVAGTVCAYPKLAELPFSEDRLWDGYPEETNAPYGLAKKMLLVQAQANRQQYGQNVIYLLPVNLYGPRDNFDLGTGHVIPSMIRRFTEAGQAGAREVVLWGDGSPTREFLYVEDAARAFRKALESYDAPDPVNIGSGEEISIRQLAELVSELCGYSGEILWDTGKPNGQPRRRLSTDRALQAFGWKAEMDLREGLQKTISWYHAELATAPGAVR